jgi:hypothetical protein
MSSIAAALLDCLRSVERPGDFCVGGRREIFMPAIDVDGVGRIALPVSRAIRQADGRRGDAAFQGGLYGTDRADFGGVDVWLNDVSRSKRSRFYRSVGV